MTFSVVAVCPDTRDVGVAVSTKALAVGGVGLVWARGGIGAVASQSFTLASYGPDALDLLAAGVAPDDALARLVQADREASLRQVAVVAHDGRTAAHTGVRCIGHAEHVQGNGAVFAANLMRYAGVPQAMAASWEESGGHPFATRLLAALDAGQAAGGDLRGQQSAAIRIAPGEPSHAGQTTLDLRADDSPAPTTELRRLYDLWLADQDAEAWQLAFDGDLPGARAEWMRLRALMPDSADTAFWAGVAYANAGDLAGAREALAYAFGREPMLRELLGRLPASGLLHVDAAMLAQLAGTTSQA